MKVSTREELVGEIGTLDNIIECLSATIREYNYHFQLKLKTVFPYWKKSNPNHYCFIPSSQTGNVVRRIMHAQQRLRSQDRIRQLKFLDCGCGIGNILVIASCLGLDATGIEYELDTYKLGKSVFTSGSTSERRIRIIKGNVIFFRHYGDYDIIYYYTPIHNRKMQMKFMKKLAKNVKIGAIVIPYDIPYEPCEGSFENNPSFRRIGDRETGYYEKIK